MDKQICVRMVSQMNNQVNAQFMGTTMTNARSRQQGFSLIELVIVIVILGLLAATAIPRFLNVTEDAEDASLDGVTGGLATAVGFVRAQWEVDGRNGTSVVLDGSTISLDENFGYPTGLISSGDITGGGNTSATGMSGGACREVFNHILQSAPRNVLSNQDARNQRYTVGVLGGAGGSAVTNEGVTVTNLDLCVYHQVASLELNATTGIPVTPPNLDVGNGIAYNPGTGTVVSFTNPNP